jgi:phospholipid/cholesterol/gamma-HCH transport system ATP-binding protein
MIEIKNLYKSFGSKMVLGGINLEIEDGTTTCIIGKSGCGKSVLLKHIVGLLEPDSGNVSINGQVVSKMTKKELFEIRRTIGYVFQGAALFDSYTVFENIIIGLFEHGQRNMLALEMEAQRVLSAVGLISDISERETESFRKEWQIFKNKKTSDLSGGMKKRVGVARALVGSPSYIFYDEPTTGLDPVTSEQIDDLIADIAGKLNVTSLVITHDMFSVFRIANRVAMLVEGKVQFNGTPAGLRTSDDANVKEFLARYHN